MPEAPRVPDLSALLSPAAVQLDAVAASKSEAIDVVGELLVASGAVERAYLLSMHEREASVSTYLGQGVAIPHGTNASRSTVAADALAFARFPAGVTWDGERAHVAIGIAARGDGHVAILGELARILLAPKRARALREATSVPDVIALLGPAGAAEATDSRAEDSRAEDEGPPQ